MILLNDRNVDIAAIDLTFCGMSYPRILLQNIVSMVIASCFT